MEKTVNTTDSELSEHTERRGSVTATAARLLEQYGLLLAWGVLFLVFSLLRPDSYPTSANIQTIFGSQAILLVLTLGLLLPLTAGDFDLSIASNMGLSAMLVAVLNVNENWPIGFAILAAVSASLVIGMINGGLVVGLGLDSFIVTLGVATFLQGLVLWISGTATIIGLDPHLSEWTVTNTFLGISIVFWYGVAATLVLWYVLQFTPLGRRLLFVGRGRSVARLSGLNVLRLRWGAFMASGAIAGAAGAMYAGVIGSVDPSSAQNYLLPAFAAVYLGATTITPGRFNAIGTFIAVYFLVSGITGLQLLGVESFVQQLFYGGALVLAVALSHFARRSSAARGVIAGQHGGRRKMLGRYSSTNGDEKGQKATAGS
jgi:ribose transport system permease protein